MQFNPRHLPCRKVNCIQIIRVTVQQPDLQNGLRRGLTTSQRRAGGTTASVASRTGRATPVASPLHPLEHHRGGGWHRSHPWVLGILFLPSSVMPCRCVFLRPFGRRERKELQSPRSRVQTPGLPLTSSVTLRVSHPSVRASASPSRTGREISVPGSSGRHRDRQGNPCKLPS